MRDKRYSVQAVSRLTGLTPDTLRAWERRYAAVVPDREGKGRRAYGEADVERLLLLKQVCDRGHAIRLVAALQNHQLKEMLAQGQESLDSLALSKDVVERLLTAIDSFSIREFEQELGRAMVTLDMRQVVVDVLEPLLKAIGDRWESGALSVAQEHVVSASIRTILGGVLRQYPRRNGAGAIVLTTLSDELHEFGILMLHLWASSEGYGCHYLGPNLPSAEIVRAMRLTGGTILGISVVRRDNPEAAAAQLRDIIAQLRGTEVEIWLGGSGVEYVLPHLGGDPVIHVANLGEFEHRLQLSRAR